MTSNGLAIDGTWFTRYIPRVDATVTNLAELSNEVVGQPDAYHRGSLRRKVNKLFVTFLLLFTLFDLSLPSPCTWCDGAVLTQTAVS